MMILRCVMNANFYTRGPHLCLSPIQKKSRKEVLIGEEWRLLASPSIDLADPNPYSPRSKEKRGTFGIRRQIASLRSGPRTYPSHLTAMWPRASSFTSLGFPYIAWQFPELWNGAVNGSLLSLPHPPWGCVDRICFVNSIVIYDC